MEGLKFDNGKLKMSLMVPRFLHGLIKVLMFGTEKYAAHSWQKVENGDVRYYEALRRHLDAMQKDNGELDLGALDEESGLPHLWHVQCNSYFLEYFREKVK